MKSKESINKILWKYILFLILTLDFGLWTLDSSFGASAPKLIHWQGNLRDSNGVPLSGTNFNFTFKLFDTASVGTGTELWSEAYANNTVTNGLYEFSLGSIVAIPDSAFIIDPLYLEIRVSTGANALQTLSPRVRLVSAPFAVHALWADRVRGDYTLNIDAGGVVSTFTAAGHFQIPGGIALNNSATPSAGQIIFGTGANETLNASQVASLVGGVVSNADALHTHTLAGFYILLQNTLQSGATFFVSSASVDGQTLLARSSGNVGIGTANPTAKLELVGGSLALPLGSAGAPSYIFTGDANAGLFSSGADTLNFATSGVERMRIGSTGYIGIGTNSPSYLLHISSAGNPLGSSDSLLALANTADTTVSMEFIRSNRVWVVGQNRPPDLPGDEYAQHFFIYDQTANNTRLRINTNGGLLIDLPGLQTGYALCHTNQSTIIDEEIVDCGSAPQADYAEQYPVARGLDYGDLVALGEQIVEDKEGNHLRALIKSAKPYQENMIGVISNNYGDFTSAGHNIDQKDNPMPVALNGRVPVKVTLENGSIQAGDYLTSSSKPGYAMKATKPGPVIGIALESFGLERSKVEKEGKILVFLNLGERHVAKKVEDLERRLEKIESTLLPKN